jgi:DNA-directed RNA polymerase specialized sigma24 family protein
MAAPEPPPAGGAVIQWDEARAFLRERIAAQLRSTDASTIEDLTQEALIRSWRALGRGAVRSPQALMHTIAQRTCKDHFRRRKLADLFRPLGDIEPPVPDQEGIPSDVIERIRFTMLEFFRINSSSCLELARAYFAEQNWASVARKAGRSHEAVRRQWSRCVDRLRAEARRGPGWLSQLLDQVEP